MTRADILDTARQAITVDRAAAHGNAEDSFTRIAGHWTWWLQDKLQADASITAHDVAQMMVGFKQARIMGNPGHRDSHVDATGYAAIGGEIATATAPEPTQLLHGLPVSAAEAAAVPKSSNAKPAYQPGERQARAHYPGWAD